MTIPTKIFLNQWEFKPKDMTKKQILQEAKIKYPKFSSSGMFLTYNAARMEAVEWVLSQFQQNKVEERELLIEEKLKEYFNKYPVDSFGIDCGEIAKAVINC